jgi:hypothetical protein
MNDAPLALRGPLPWRQTIVTNACLLSHVEVVRISNTVSWRASSIIVGFIVENSHTGNRIIMAGKQVVIVVEHEAPCTKEIYAVYIDLRILLSGTSHPPISPIGLRNHKNLSESSYFYFII